MFITLEGPEGSGKTTQIALLAESLRSRGVKVIVTREPGGTPLGEQLRALLLESELVPSPEAEAYLMTAARAEHVRTVIRPALERGAWVLCDRFADSTLAYQGAGRGLDIDALRALQGLALAGLTPDRTYLLDIDVAEGLRRRRDDGEQNRLDAETVSFHQRVGAWYRAEAARDPGRWKVIDARQSIDGVQDAIRADVAQLPALASVV